MVVVAKREKEKHKALKSLPEEKLVAIGELFRRGEAASYICKVIQGPWGLLKEEDPENLRKNLLRYQKDVIKYQIVEELVDKNLVDAVTRIARKVDVANELTTLVYTQRARLDKLLEREMQMAGILNPVVSREISLFRILLNDIKQLHLETGAIPRAPKEIEMHQPDEHGVTRFRITSGTSPALEAFLNDESYVVIEN
jgi:hypothetical protein